MPDLPSSAKTVIIGKTPVQIALTADKYVAGADEFGRDTVIGINFSPVVRNVFAGMFN